jgi:activator of HSP90 ATPase
MRRMSTDTLRLTALISVDARTLCAAWLDTRGHSDMTGAAATADDNPGSEFTAWDGYIRGTTIEVDPGQRIVQTWRTSEFPEEAPDSTLEILFEPEGDGTRLTLLHTEIPEGQGDKYRSGWQEFYFVPMQRFFGGSKSSKSAKAAKGNRTKASARAAKKPMRVAKKKAARPATKKAKRAAAKTKRPRARAKKKR